MSRNLFSIIIIIVIFNLFLPHDIYATACSDATIGIANLPKIYPEDSDQNAKSVFIFNVLTSGAKQALDGKDIRFYHRTETLPNPLLEWRSEPYEKFTQSQSTFSITIERTKENETLFTQGDKNGRLAISPAGQDQYQPLCDEVKFHVGVKDADKCEINPPLPSRIPPNQSLGFRFVGRPETKYSIFIDNTAPLAGNQVITTNNFGEGYFLGIIFKGNAGEEKEIKISANNKGSCNVKVKLSLSAPIASTSTGGAGAVSANSAGQPCQIILNGKAYDGIHTAIGCIPKEPEGIIKAILALGIAIGGGIAFLIMLFGAFQLITSAGNPDTVKAGHDKIINAVIGLLFIVFSVLLLQIIGQDILKIPGFGP